MTDLKFTDDEIQALLAPLRVEPSAQYMADYLEAFLKLGHLGTAYRVQHGILCRAAPLPSDVPAGAKQMCYQNAGMLAAERDDLTYVEGWALGDAFVTEHAWCIDENRNVIDPTWDTPENAVYFGVPVDTEFMTMATLKSKLWGLFHNMTPRYWIEATPEEKLAPRWRPEIESRPTAARLQEMMDSVLHP